MLGDDRGAEGEVPVERTGSGTEMADALPAGAGLVYSSSSSSVSYSVPGTISTEVLQPDQIGDLLVG
jgi:hypothetical protein